MKITEKQIKAMTKCYFTSTRCTVSSVDKTQNSENSLYSNCKSIN